MVFSSKEFNMKMGSVGKGLIYSILAFIKFFIVPLLIVTSIGMAGEGVEEDWWPTVETMLEDLTPIIMMFGIALTAAAFPRGFYPKGSYPRFIFSLVCAALVLLYAYLLMLDGDVQSFFDSEDIDLNVMFVFLLFTLLATIRTLQHLGELPDHRWEFQALMSNKLGTPMPSPIPIEEAEKHRIWYDFKPKYGRLEPGFKDSRKAAGKFLAWPAFLLMIVGIVVTKVGDNVPVEFKNELDGLIGVVLIIGTLLIILMFFKGFYPKGSVSRMSFWVISVVLICILVWYLSFGGDVAIEIMDVVSVSFNYTPLVMLFMLAVALWAVYAIVEMFSYRKDWKANNFLPVDDKKISSMKKLQKREAKEKAKAEKAQRKLDERRQSKE